MPTMKVKLSDFAADLNLPAEELIEQLKRLDDKTRKATSSITETEMNYLLESISQARAVADFKAYYADRSVQQAEPQQTVKKPTRTARPTVKKEENAEKPEKKKKEKPASPAKAEKPAAEKPAKAEKPAQPAEEVKEAAPAVREAPVTEAPAAEESPAAPRVVTAAMTEQRARERAAMYERQQAEKAARKAQNQQQQAAKQAAKAAAAAKQTAQPAQPAAAPAAKPAAEQPKKAPAQPPQPRQPKAPKKPAKAQERGERAVIEMDFAASTDVQPSQQRHTIDTRGSYVDLDKYNERYEQIAPQGRGGKRDNNAAKKQKITQKSQQRARQQKSGKVRETEAEKLRVLRYRRRRSEARQKAAAQGSDSGQHCRQRTGNPPEGAGPRCHQETDGTRCHGQYQRRN